MADGLAQFSLAGRRILVTGASRGIGRALAIGLADAGAAVAVAARTPEGLAETITDLNVRGATPVSVAMDVSRPADCARGVAEAAAALGGLDILVNNAGIEEVRPS